MLLAQWAHFMNYLLYSSNRLQEVVLFLLPAGRKTGPHALLTAEETTISAPVPQPNLNMTAPELWLLPEFLSLLLFLKPYYGKGQQRVLFCITYILKWTNSLQAQLGEVKGGDRSENCLFSGAEGNNKEIWPTASFCHCPNAAFLNNQNSQSSHQWLSTYMYYYPPKSGCHFACFTDEESCSSERLSTFLKVAQPGGCRSQFRSKLPSSKTHAHSSSAPPCLHVSIPYIV